jgi:hypothetical protein
VLRAYEECVQQSIQEAAIGARPASFAFCAGRIQAISCRTTIRQGRASTASVAQLNHLRAAELSQGCSSNAEAAVHLASAWVMDPDALPTTINWVTFIAQADCCLNQFFSLFRLISFLVICLEALWKEVGGSSPFNGPDP